MKNPLYVVKGKNVMEAKGLFDLVVKKLNLEPLVEVLKSLLKMLLEQVKSYHMLLIVKTMIDEYMKKITAMMNKFGMV
jgi:hypothetical protein